MKRLMAVLAIACMVLPLTVRAEDDDGDSEELYASLDLPVLSAYTWRGQVYNDEAVFEPSLTVGKGGFSINVWGNYNFTDKFSEETENEVSEVDFTLDYSHDTGPVTLSAGYVEYLFPHQVTDGEVLDNARIIPAQAVHGTREVYASVAPNECPLNSVLTVYYDFDEVDGAYATISFSRSVGITEEVSADVGFSSGFANSDYNEFYFGVDDDALNDGNVSLSLPISCCENVTVTPAVEYTWLWDNDIEDGAEAIYGEKDSVVGSLTVTYDF